MSVFNSQGESLVSVSLMLSRQEAEEVLIAIDQRRRSKRVDSFLLEEVGLRFGGYFEMAFGADSGWWQRIRGAAK